MNSKVFSITLDNASTMNEFVVVYDNDLEYGCSRD
jgi:hypothetical protein